jgi:hypothetical protein
MSILDSNFFTDGTPVSALYNITQYLIVATRGGTLQIRDINPPFSLIREITTIKNPFTCFTVFNNLLYVNHTENILDVWDLRELIIIKRVPLLTKSPFVIESSKQYLVIVEEKTVEVIGREKEEFLGIMNISDSRSFNKLEKVLIAEHKLYLKYNFTDKIRVFNLITLKEEKTFNPGETISTFFVTTDILCLATEDCLETRDNDCKLIIWDSALFKPIKIIKVTDENYFDLKVDSPPNPTLLYASTLNSVDVWEWNSWKQIHHYEGLRPINSSLLTSSMLFIGTTEGYVNIWRLKDI